MSVAIKGHYKAKQLRDFDRRPEDALGTRRADSNNEVDASHEAMAALAKVGAEQLEAKLFNDQQCNEFAESATNYERTTGNVLKKPEALERHVKTVTMRAESLVMTEDECNATLIQKHEEAQVRVITPASHPNTLASTGGPSSFAPRVGPERSSCPPCCVVLHKLEVNLCFGRSALSKTCVSGFFFFSSMEPHAVYRQRLGPSCHRMWSALRERTRHTLWSCTPCVYRVHWYDSAGFFLPETTCGPPWTSTWRPPRTSQ